MTSHELARELLSGPDLPVYHYDPSYAGLDEEDDPSLSVPTVEVNSPGRWQKRWPSFITIVGEQDQIEEAEWLDELRDDRRRLLWVLWCIGQHGTAGLTKCVQWGIDAPFDRAAIDEAMRTFPIQRADPPPF